MNSILAARDTIAAIRQRKMAIRKKLDSSKQQMTGFASSLTAGPLPETTNRMQTISRLIMGGLFIYRGYRFCSDIVGGIHSIFSPKKRRSTRRR